MAWLLLSGARPAASVVRAPSVRTAASRPSGRGGATARRRALRTVFLIVMENHDWSGIKGNPSAPYINHTLLPMASHAERYYTPPGNHPSLPNYLWLEAGTSFGISDDNDPGANHRSTTAHLTALLDRARISWKAYEESIDGSRCPLSGTGSYAPRHDPFVYFDDVTGANNPRSAYCIAHIRPYTELERDLRKNTVARYNFITPNTCNDMHDTCSLFGDSVKQGDTWLSTHVPAILSSRAYRNGGVLFIVWDEGDGSSDGPIGLIVLSRAAKGHGYAGMAHYTHSSTLRTLEEIFGVTPLLGDARNARDLRDLFAAFP